MTRCSYARKRQSLAEPAARRGAGVARLVPERGVTLGANNDVTGCAAQSDLKRYDFSSQAWATRKYARPTRTVTRTLPEDGWLRCAGSMRTSAAPPCVSLSLAPNGRHPMRWRWRPSGAVATSSSGRRECRAHPRRRARPAGGGDGRALIALDGEDTTETAFELQLSDCLERNRPISG